MTTTTLEFLGKRIESEAVIDALPEPSRAVLRQFSLERLMGYGVAYPDAIELRAAVIDGAEWQAAAIRLADIVEAQARAETASVPTRIAALRRASALLRMAQVMLLADTDERRAVFARAVALFGEAAALAGNGEPVLIEMPGGPLAGWFYRAAGEAVGAAIVIGGVEGWAMDFASQGEALAARGVDALMLDGPGQGESRFAHRHYLRADWPDAYRAAIDHLAALSPGRPLAFVGNSLGGSIAMTIANADPRIQICCANGAIVRPTPPPGAPPGGPSLFFAKMLVASGTDDASVAQAAFGRIDPLTPGAGGDYALLIVHGGKDMAVPRAAADILLAQAPARDKRLVVFSDGDHCVYNHREDRDALIADWVRTRLSS